MADRSDARVVEFWQIVEMFSPHAVGKPDAMRWHSSVRAGEPLPWQDGHKPKGEPLSDDLVWRHTIYLGVYSIDAVFDTLKRVFEPDKESFGRRPKGKTAVAAFTVDERGRAVLGSEVLSTCAWGLGQVLRNKHNMRDWLELFSEAQADFLNAVEDIVSLEPADIPNDTPMPPVLAVIDHDMLRQCLAAAVEGTGVPTELGAVEILVET